MSRDRLTPLLAGLATALTCWSLSPVVDEPAWQSPCLAVVLTVLVLRYGAMALRLPVLLGLLLQLVGGLVTVTAMFAREVAWLGFLPGPAALSRLAELAVDGVDTISRYSTPVPTSQGITLVVTVGVLAVAVAVDLAAAGLRAPAAAGLPLLALYAVPAAVVPGGLSWPAFAAAAAGWLLLLAHDASSQVLRWGRLLPRWGGGVASRQTVGTDTAALAATGRRLGLLAVAAAVVVPAMLPAVPAGLLGATRTGSGSGALSNLTVINPVLTLRDSLEPRQDLTILRYRTTQADVQPLRIVTADTFDGTSWQPGTQDVSRRNRASRGLPAPPGLSSAVSQREYSMRIEVGPHLDQDFLPVPYPTRRVDLKGAWLYDASSLNIIGDGQSVRGKKYTVSYLAVRPTIEQLRGAQRTVPSTLQPFTQVPDSLPQIVAATARSVTADSATPYDQAMALQQWFRSGGGFSYSTDAPSDSGGDAVADFLADRKGFCIQFSSAMAVMARTLGIPARIGVGFLPGTPDRDDWWSVKLTDAHAWPELYFSGVGWVRFEPTPAARTGAPPRWAQVGASGSPTVGSSTPTTTPAASASAGSDPRVQALADAERRARDRAVHPLTAPPLPAGARSWLPIVKVTGVVALLLASLLVVPVTSALTRRRRRAGGSTPGDHAEACWSDLLEQCADLGIAMSPALTPRQVHQRLAEQLPAADQARDALLRVSGSVQHTRYARPTSSPTSSAIAARQDLEVDVRDVVRAVASTRTRWRRWQARVFPASGAARLRSLLQPVGQRLGTLDLRLARGAHQVRWPRRHQT